MWSGVVSNGSGVRKEEWSDFGGEWSAKRRVEWFRTGVECEKKSGVVSEESGVINVESSGFGGE